jgi:tRNA pseudouridine38-40 synthase
MNPYNWVPALNTKLPATIRVMDCQEVAPDFHARFDATSKTYTYDLCLAPVLPPLRAGLAWHLPRQLDPASLAEALERYCGTHDFRAFAANRGNETEATDYHRTLSAATLAESADGYRITFTGSGFLYKMVRLLTGAAVQVAQGRLRVEDLAALLDQPADLPRGKSPYCAPADGLTLASVSYG